MDKRQRMLTRRAIIAAGVLCAAARLSATPLTVGPGKTYATPAAAFAAATNGDTILIDAITYTNDYPGTIARHNLTIRGAGGRPRMLSTIQPPNLKGIWVIGGTNTTIDNVEFSGASLSSTNGANGSGIRQEGDTLTLRNCCFHDNNDGILVAASATSDILIESCEFYRNGYTNVADNPGGAYVGYAHNMYIGNVRTFTLRYCYTHASVGQGHLVKSRANTNYILYNRITDESAGTGSYALQLAQGGLSFVVGNLIEKGPANVNHSRVICFADENQNNPVQSLYFANNTVVNDLTGYTPTFIHTGGTPVGKVVNNLFVGPGTLTDAGASLAMTNNLSLTTAQSTQLVSCSGFDYHLIPTATAIDSGVTPGVYSNFDLTPVCEYVHPATGQVRAVEWKLDVGAYESTNAVGDRNGDGMEDNWQRRFFGTLASPCTAPGHTNVNGFTTLQCFQAGLIPTNPASRLTLRTLAITNGSVTVNWLGGTSVWQYVETRQDLSNPSEVWRAVYTNPPTLQTTGTARISITTNRSLFFRISAGQSSP